MQSNWANLTRESMFQATQQHIDVNGSLHEDTMSTMTKSRLTTLTELIESVRECYDEAFIPLYLPPPRSHAHAQPKQARVRG